MFRQRQGVENCIVDDITEPLHKSLVFHLSGIHFVDADFPCGRLRDLAAIGFAG